MFPKFHSADSEAAAAFGCTRPTSTSTKRVPGNPCSPSLLTVLKKTAAGISLAIVASSASLKRVIEPGVGGNGIGSQTFSSKASGPPCKDTEGDSFDIGVNDEVIPCAREEVKECS